MARFIGETALYQRMHELLDTTSPEHTFYIYRDINFNRMTNLKIREFVEFIFKDIPDDGKADSVSALPKGTNWLNPEQKSHVNGGKNGSNL